MTAPYKPIHPGSWIAPDGVQRPNLGITLREHYAGLAMQGLLAACNGVIEPKYIGMVTERSIQMADTLIKTLKDNPA